MLKGLTISTTIILVAMSGFNLNDKANEIQNKLVGTWELDIESFPNGEYYSATKTLVFENKNNFSYEWFKDDYGGIIKGKYFVLENPNHVYKTLSLIPDLRINYKDTIRDFINFDILDINSERLHLISETNYIERDSIPDIIFNKNYIYKRIKK